MLFSSIQFFIFFNPEFLITKGSSRHQGPTKRRPDLSDFEHHPFSQTANLTFFPKLEVTENTQFENYNHAR